MTMTIKLLHIIANINPDMTFQEIIQIFENTNYPYLEEEKKPN